MSRETTTTGGFAGDPAEAFTAPASSVCCGSSPAATGQASNCCGTVEPADAAGGCCEATAKTDPVPAATGCCE